MPLDDEFVEVVGLGRVEGAECEIVEDEEVDAGEFAHLCLEAVVQPGGAEAGEELVGAGGVDAEAAADPDVSERGGQVRLSDADGPQNQDAVAGLGEPQAGQVREQHPVIGEVVGFVPGVQTHRRVQAGGASAQHRRAGLAAGDLVVQEQFEERGVAHLAGPGQGESLGQGVLEASELQGPQRLHQVGADRVHRPGRRSGRGARRGGHGVVSSSGLTDGLAGLFATPGVRVSCARGPVAYSAGSRANRPVVAPAAAGSTGSSRSIAFSSIEAILATETTSRSRDREQAVSTGPGP